MKRTLAVLACLLAFIAAPASSPAADEARSNDRVSFARDVWPILRANCVSCHRPGKLKGGLDLTSFASVTKGGKSGAVLKKNMPQDSELLTLVKGDNPTMPPEGEKLTAAEVDVLARWIAQGATDDTPPDGLGW